MSFIVTREREPPTLRGLRSIPVFSAMDERDLVDLAGRFSSRTFAKGAVLYRRGETGRKLYVIDAGAVALGTSTPDGRQAAYAILGPREVFGILSLFGSM